MVLYQLTIARIIQIYVGYGSIAAFFLYLAYKTLRQEKKRLNVIFSFLYIFTAIGMIITFIYAPITISEIATMLHYIAIYIIIFSTIFLLAFILTFLKTEEVFDAKKLFTLIIIFAILTSIIFFIPDGIEINESTGWNPHWSWPLYIYVAVLMASFPIAPSLYYSTLIYKKFEDDLLKKKWRFFMIGMSELFIVALGTFLVHAINNPTLRIIFGPISAILSISGAYLMYYGYAKKFKPK
ncbi:MAG: hypothetical protein ACFFAO_21195 [Candidatus Hermodarchaeota archaeon]